MKLVLANNQSQKFREFYSRLPDYGAAPVDYAGYTNLLFIFDDAAGQKVRAVHFETGRSLDAYEAVYLNSYLNSYELAATTALCCDALGVPFLNTELRNAPSLSKLTMHAKLAAKAVATPYTICGAKRAILRAVEAENYISDDAFPAVLKRADADRGVDNFKVTNRSELAGHLADHSNSSLWVLQPFVAHDGYHTICVYDGQVQFSIYRKLQERPDGKADKAHMYKPKGGANASLIEAADVPQELTGLAQRAAKAMDRQICSVDCLLDKDGRAYVLEVNYNPQMVTIETFREVRIKAFVDFLGRDWTSAASS